jgi:hypothetical protein
MSWQEEDHRFLLSAAAELNDYLSSSILEWNLRDSKLVLTPGRLLLTLKRLSALRENDSQVLIAVNSANTLIRTRDLLWQRKVSLEIPVRLRVWENALLDFSDEGLDKSYSAQVIHRVILRLLEEDSPDQFGHFIDRLETLDDTLRKLIENGDFIWDRELAEAFSRGDFWFLYASNRSRK